MNKKKKRTFGDNGFEDWGGYMAAKKAKLQDQFNVNANKEGIFKGISIHVNGYTDPTAEELKRIMMDHGGTYHHYYSTKKTTHIIATNLPDVKIKELKSLHVKVVKPDWITNSLKAGTLLDYRDFLLYSHQSTTQPCLKFQVAESSSKSEEKPLDTVVVAEDPPPEIKDNTSPKLSDKPSSARPARTAVEPNFLSEFYNNSRLHHISTMGATFKQYVNKLRQENQTNFPGRERLKSWMANNGGESSSMRHNDELMFSINDSLDTHPQSTNQSGKVIMHIDMDCFFVSVGIRDRPELKGIPVAVTHSKGSAGKAREGADIEFERNYYKQRREAKFKNKTGQDSEVTIESRIDNLNENESLSEIASCSYEARRAGVKNGMFMGTAIKLCPGLRAIPYDFEGYKEVASILYDTVASYTLDIEAVSCDEMFVDCTNLLNETGATPLDFASCLRAEIKEKTRCPASAGFGSNRLLARLATKKAKPDGQFYLEENAVVHHMRSIPVGELPGVGYAMVHRLRSMGIGTCEDLQKLTMDQLRLEGLGMKTAQALYNHCRGVDDRPLTFGQQRKSVSAEINYGIRFQTNDEAVDFLQRLSAEVHTRLAGDGARSVTLKLMVRAKDAPTETAKYMGHGVCDNFTRSSSLLRAVRTPDAITKEVLSLYKSMNCNPSDLRGIGIQLSRLEKSTGSEVGGLDAFLVKKTDPKTPQKVEPPKETVSADKPISPAGKVKLNNSPSKRKKKQPAPAPDTKTIKDFMRPRKKSPQRFDRSKLEIDPDVLAELPEDIRHEILEEYSKNADRPATPAFPVHRAINEETQADSPSSLYNVSFSQVDQEYLQQLPADLRDEIETGLLERKKRKQQQSERNEQPTSYKESLRDMITPANLKPLLRSWIVSSPVPQDCDVKMVTEFLQEMIISRDIDSIVPIMRGFFRPVSKGQNSGWREAYTQIATQVQSTMLSVYKARLDIPEQ